MAAVLLRALQRGGQELHWPEVRDAADEGDAELGAAELRGALLPALARPGPVLPRHPRRGQRHHALAQAAERRVLRREPGVK